MSDFEKHLAKQIKDSEFAAAYDELEAQYAFARQVIAVRLAAGITQAELAQRVGTSQANISKLGTLNPSFDMARRVAVGLGKRLNITI